MACPSLHGLLVPMQPDAACLPAVPQLISDKPSPPFPTGRRCVQPHVMLSYWTHGTGRLSFHGYRGRDGFHVVQLWLHAFVSDGGCCQCHGMPVSEVDKRSGDDTTVLVRVISSVEEWEI